MTDIVEKYKQRHDDPRDAFKLKKESLSFDTRKEFYNYLETVDDPHRMGTYICTVGPTKYLLEVEPWMTGCLEHYTKWKPKNIRLAQQVFLKVHKIRLGMDPTEAGFLPTIKNRPRIIDVLGNEEWLGLSYAMVKLDE